MEKVLINLNEDAYTIYIKNNLLNSISELLPRADKYFIISDQNVSRIYLDGLLKSLSGNKLYQFIIEAGESSKNLLVVENILNTMIEKNLSRNSMVIALGGGVVGDIAGFCASIFMRGIGFIQVPTTLLAQVDSSVGGKTGVNMAGGKNLVGSFYQPHAVLIDTLTLNSLSRREIISGLGEIIKYGIVWDYVFFDYIDKKLDVILDLDEKTLNEVIKRCCTIKAEIVAKDEKEIGLRKILNFGHTIAHSLECITNYKKYSHGEAVVIGIYYESLIGHSLGLIDDNYLKKIKNLILKLEIDLDITKYPKSSLIEAMAKDKKNKEGKISFILPVARGQVEEVLLNKGEIFW